MQQDMTAVRQEDQGLFKKIRTLSPQRVAEVEDFVDFLHQRDADRGLTWEAAKLSENVFRKVWDNPDDADYDQL